MIDVDLHNIPVTQPIEPPFAEPVLPLNMAGKVHDDHLIKEEIHEAIEAEPEAKPVQPKRLRDRIQIAIKWVLHSLTNAADRAIILLMAVGMLALLKWGACQCGVPVP